MMDRTKISALLSGVIYFTSVFYPLTSLAAANGGNDADGSKGANGNKAGQVRPVVLDSPQTSYNGQDKTKPVIIGADSQNGQIGGQAAPRGNSNDNLSGNSDGNLSTTPNSNSSTNPSGNLGNVPNANPNGNKFTDKDKQVQAQKPGNSAAASEIPGEKRNLKRNRRDLTSLPLDSDNYLPGGGEMLACCYFLLSSRVKAGRIFLQTVIFKITVRAFRGIRIILYLPEAVRNNWKMPSRLLILKE